VWINQLERWLIHTGLFAAGVDQPALKLVREVIRAAPGPEAD
jgi:hypothetical protein